MKQQMLTSQFVADYLNGLLGLTPKAIENLIRVRVCADDKTAFLESDTTLVATESVDGMVQFGVIGLLNGLVTEGRVAAVYNKDVFIGFKSVTVEEVTKGKDQ